MQTQLAPEFQGTPEGTEAYIRQYVDGYTDLDSYLDMIGRETVELLSKTGTAFLLDPFRQWIKTPEEIRALSSGEAQ